MEDPFVSSGRASCFIWPPHATVCFDEINPARLKIEARWWTSVGTNISKMKHMGTKHAHLVQLSTTHWKKKVRTTQRLSVSRRDVFGLGLVAISGVQIDGVNQANAAQFTGKKSWNGVVEGSTCPLGDEGEECRLGEIGKDALQLKQKVQNAGKLDRSVDVKMDNKYVLETQELSSTIQNYLALDVFDSKRKSAIAEIQTEGKQWVSKYAPGGSARFQSAQKFYVVIASLLGHFAFQGLAPLPKEKVSKIKSGIENADALILKGL